MAIKKYTLLVFLFAIVIIMAHSIVPHHHHSDHICFELSFMAEKHKDSTAHQYESTCCEHSTSSQATSANSDSKSITHDAGHEADASLPETRHDDSSSCQLIELLVYYPAPQQDALKCPVCQLDNNVPNYFAPALISANVQLQIAGNSLPFRQHPYLLPYIDHVAGQSLGLRAPPHC